MESNGVPSAVIAIQIDMTAASLQKSRFPIVFFAHHASDPIVNELHHVAQVMVENRPASTMPCFHKSDPVGLDMQDLHYLNGQPEYPSTLRTVDLAQLGTFCRKEDLACSFYKTDPNPSCFLQTGRRLSHEKAHEDEFASDFCVFPILNDKKLAWKYFAIKAAPTFQKLPPSITLASFHLHMRADRVGLNHLGAWVTFYLFSSCFSSPFFILIFLAKRLVRFRRLFCATEKDETSDS